MVIASLSAYGLCLIRMKVLQDKQYFLMVGDGKRVPLSVKSRDGAVTILEVSEEAQERPMFAGTWSVSVSDDMLHS